MTVYLWKVELKSKHKSDNFDAVWNESYILASDFDDAVKMAHNLKERESKEFQEISFEIVKLERQFKIESFKKEA